MKRHVLVLHTGGTIGSVDSGRGLEPQDGLDLTASGAAWSTVIPEADVTIEQVFSIPSGAIGLPEIAKIQRRIRQAERESFTGVVVTHGTDSLAETAFVLTVLGPWTIPVVLTGAMRALGQLGSDAERNLRDALTVAVSRASAHSGPIVSMDGAVFPGLTAEKTSCHATAAFTAPDGAPLGYISEGQLWLQQLSSPTSLSCPIAPEVTRPVALISATPGDDGGLLRFCAQRYAGIVVHGFGGGHLPPQMMPALAEVARDTPTIVTTSYPGAVALTRTYGGPGSEQAISETGAYVGWSLSARKAALLLAMCLGQTDDRQILATTLEEVRSSYVERS